MKKGLLYLILLFATIAKSQSDSAQYFLKSKLPAFQKIIRCLNAAAKTRDHNTAVLYFNKLTAIPEIGKNKDIFCFACGRMASIVGDMGNISESIKYCNLGLDRGGNEITDTLLSNTHNLIAYFSFALADYETAVHHSLKSVEFAEKAGNVKLKGYGYNILGLIFSEKTPPDLERSLEYFLLSEKLIIPLNIPRSSGLVYLRIGKVLALLDRFEESERYLKKAIRIGDSAKIVVVKKWALETYGTLLGRMGKKEQAISVLTEALKISEQAGDFNGYASTAFQLSSAYKANGDQRAAARYSDSAMVKAEKAGLLAIVCNASKLRSQIFEDDGDFRNALIYFKKYKVILDSISKKESVKNLEEMEQKFKNQKQAKELVEKEKELIKQRSDTERQQAIKNYFIAGALVLALFLVIAYRGYRNKQRSERLLQEKNHLIEEKNKEILDSINYAKRIQSAIIPSSKIVSTHLPNNFILYKPKDIVAGDFYWLQQHTDTVLFAAADCTGHGVPGAMVSVVCNNALNRSIREFEIYEPGKILDKTRELILEEFEKSEEDVKDGMDISLCALSFRERTLFWSGANNPLWILRKDGMEVEEIKPNKQPIGKYADAKPFTTHKISLNEGDTIYVFTDGYQDQFGGEKGKKFKAAKLKELFISMKGEPMKIQKEKINETFEKWKGDLEQVDDVCIIGVRI
jgi:serine phosphatase RsbU (regulator of sigma subunit)